MQRAVAVIGANWGDEGKGLMTDYHARSDDLVVRFNGGAQASHTVERDGKKHIFRHFSSGSLRGATTFLSRHFLNNPVLYFKELDILRKIDCNPMVLVDPNGLVTTPWDMMINQIAEEARGGTRHGSCGVGINETIKRSEHEEYQLTVSDLRHTKALNDAIRFRILKTWVPERLHALGLEPSDEWMKLLDLKGSQSVAAFMSYCEEYLIHVATSFIPKNWPTQIVFEGAQGLLLDEDHRFFPHVTHSHTGLKNVMEICSDAGIEELDVTYVTRAYATRHGAGPFPREMVGLSYKDETNVPNAWQGSIRFGELDVDLLAESISDDGKHAFIPIHRHLAVTCLNQVGDSMNYWYQDRRFEDQTTLEAVSAIGKIVKVEKVYCGFGPQAKDVFVLADF